MEIKYTNKSKLLLWVAVVYVLSFICYLPVLLEKHGIVLNNGWLLLKYLFVCIPAITTTLLLICEHNLKTYVVQMFSGKIAVRHILIWAIFMAVGLIVSYFYSLTTGVDVFSNTYFSIPTLVTGCVYLLVTGFVEEIAWRGFLLERVSFSKKSIYNIMFVGIVWTIWHMPMWIIRNSLGIGQIMYLCIWTILVSYVLGITYYQCRNVLLISVLHATFNISYLAPIQYNIAVLIIVIAVGTLLMKKHKGLDG